MKKMITMTLASVLLIGCATVPETTEADNQETKSKSGFSWGKALAMSVGAVAGGGLKLDTDTQANIIAGIVLDSMDDNTGTSNFNAAVSDAVTPTGNTSALSEASGSSGTTSFYKLNYTCPSGSSGTIDVPYKTERGKQLRINLAKAGACNQIEEMNAALESCQAAFGNQACEE